MSVPPPYAPPPANFGGAYEVTQDDKTMAMIAHLLGIVSSFVGPLIIYLIKKDQSKFVAANAMQAVIFQAAIFIGYIIGGILAFVGIGILVNAALGIVSIIFAIIGGLAANKGEMYSYPGTGSFAAKQTGAL